MDIQLKELVEKFAKEINMDDIEVEEFNDHIYLCNDFRQLGTIQKEDKGYCIYLDSNEFKSSKFSSRGWK